MRALKPSVVDGDAALGVNGVSSFVRAGPHSEHDNGFCGAGRPAGSRYSAWLERAGELGNGSALWISGIGRRLVEKH